MSTNQKNSADSTKETKQDSGNTIEEPIPTDIGYPIVFALDKDFSTAANGSLGLRFRWKSSTGHTVHLAGCDIEKTLNYPGEGPFVPNNPPFLFWSLTNPESDTFSALDLSYLHNAKLPGLFALPYKEFSFFGELAFTYTRPWFDEPKPLWGPKKITHSVYKEGGGWKYKVEIDGLSSTIELP